MFKVAADVPDPRTVKPTCDSFPHLLMRGAISAATPNSNVRHRVGDR